MAVSKRSLSLGRDYVGQGSVGGGSRSRHSPVAQWRVEHGLPEAPHADHTCSGKCSFINVVDNVYLCERCGREHICDESCKERVLDTANGMPVCPISGMCFDQLDVGWEVNLNPHCCFCVCTCSALGVIAMILLTKLLCPNVKYCPVYECHQVG